MTKFIGVDVCNFSCCSIRYNLVGVMYACQSLP